MISIRTALTILAAFACGAVTAALFVSQPIPAPDDMPSAQASAPSSAAPSPRAVQQSKPEPRVVSAPPPSQEPQTTGAAPAGSTPQPAQSPNADLQLSATNSCNQTACSRAYRSFDSARCTYQPASGGPRRHCEREALSSRADHD